MTVRQPVEIGFHLRGGRRRARTAGPPPAAAAFPHARFLTPRRADDILGPMISRREFLGSLTAASLAGCGDTAAERRKPNILFLMPDQYRGMDLGAMGNPEVHTPRLDRLASDGVLLTNTIANCPVCCPARGTILTGRYAHHHGVAVNDAPLPNAEKTLAEILKEHGYRTGFCGKWHLEGGKRQPGFVPPGPRRQGFDFWAANICSHGYWNMHYFRDEPEPIEIPGYSATAFTDEALKFLNEQAQADQEGGPQPFCLFVQWGPPHNPYVAPPEFMNLYHPDELTMRPNWQEDVFLGGRSDIAGYYAAISFIDHEVGRLMDALEENGQAENTIVLFTSDHGDMLGSHGRFLKRKPWEESILVPGILRYPAGAEAGQKSDLLFSHVDMAPTLLGLAGLAPPANMDGRDLSLFLARPGKDQDAAGDTAAAAGPEPESVYLQNYTPTEREEDPPWRGVRTKTHTFARHENEVWVLYNNEEDRYQLENLAGKPEAAEVQAQLDETTQAWFEKSGDDWRERQDMPYK